MEPGKIIMTVLFIVAVVAAVAIFICAVCSKKTDSRKLTSVSFSLLLLSVVIAVCRNFIF